MVIISHTMLEAIPAKKLNEPLKTKATAAKAKSVVHDAVKRIKIILFLLVGDVLVIGPNVMLTCFERGWHHSHRARQTTLGRYTDGRGSQEDLHRRQQQGPGGRRRRGGSRPFWFLVVLL